jgi:HSP20 family protein
MTPGFAPVGNIYEDEPTLTLKIELPGIDEKDEKDIDVRIENITLTVHGERKIEEKEENFCRIERQYGRFTRSFNRPNSVDPVAGFRQDRVEPQV